MDTAEEKTRKKIGDGARECAEAQAGTTGFAWQALQVLNGQYGKSVRRILKI